MDRAMRREWRSFKGSLPGYVALWSLLGVGFLAWRLIAGDPLGEAAALGAASLLMGALLTPIMWIRHDRDERGPLRHTFKVLGLGVLWLAAGVLVLIVVLALTGGL